MLSLLISHLFLFFTLDLSQLTPSNAHHSCIHDKFSHIPGDIHIQPRHHKSKFNTFKETSQQEYRNINIHFDSSNMNNATEDTKRYIEEAIIPPVKNLLQSAIKIIPEFATLYPNPTECGYDISVNDQVHGYNADLVIYMTTNHDPASFGVAGARYCSLFAPRNRPVFGMIEFNLARFSIRDTSVQLEQNIYTVLHELVHVLGFSTQLYNYYINPQTLQPLVNVTMKKMVNGVSITVLNTPPLTQRLRKHFNCSTLEGAYLENQGTFASIGSHFERRVFYNEFMTANVILEARFSEFTLALLEGTGWYQVNYSYAEPMTYGKNEGCDFFDTPCMNKETNMPNFQEFCSPLGSIGISWTKRGFGSCGSVFPPRRSLDLPEYFDYWGNQLVVEDKFADNCPHVQIQRDTDCEDAKYQDFAYLKNFEYFGHGSKAFLGNMALGYKMNVIHGFCFKTKCHEVSKGNYILEVFFGNNGSVNCTKNEFKNPPNSTEIEGRMICPHPKAYCEQILTEGNCQANCFGRGKCVNRQCKCDDGWSSHNCAVKTMVDKCKKCKNGGDTNRTSCFGDECVCNPKNMTCMCNLGLIQNETCLEIPNEDNSDLPDPQQEENSNNDEDPTRPVVDEPEPEPNPNPRPKDDDNSKDIPVKENPPQNGNMMLYLLISALLILIIVCFVRARSKSSGETLLNRESYARYNETFHENRASAVQLVL